MSSNYGIPVSYGYSHMTDHLDLRKTKQRPQEDPNSIMGKLVNSPQYSLFTNLLYFSGLDKVLREDKNLTVFAVPDRYIYWNFLDDIRDISPTVARYILSYHIIPFRYVIAEMMSAYTYIETKNKYYKLRIDGRGLSPQIGFRKQLTSTTPSMNFTPQILRGDIEANNGVIHILDALLLPPPVANMEMDPVW